MKDAYKILTVFKADSDAYFRALYTENSQVPLRYFVHKTASHAKSERCVCIFGHFNDCAQSINGVAVNALKEQEV